MTHDEYIRARGAVETMLATFHNLYPWCELRISKDTIHLKDLRATRAIRKHGLKGDNWKSKDSPNHIAEIVHGISEATDG